LFVFEIVACFLPRLAWSVVLKVYASHQSWVDRYMPPYPTFLPRLAGTHSPPDLSLPHNLDYTMSQCHSTQLLDRVLETFCPDWPPTTIPLISVSHVTYKCEPPVLAINAFLKISYTLPSRTKFYSFKFHHFFPRVMSHVPHLSFSVNIVLPP
jgi:hypothetical protein